ncbi:Immunoglobulin-like domain [Trinorchestia longiramus]|nr:Immunoglobulin-like domain [Trinorchestia longiramus]
MFGMNVMAWNGGDLEKLEVLQNRVERLALGAPKWTAVEAIRGDLGWSLFSEKMVKTVLNYEVRIEQMENKRSKHSVSETKSSQHQYRTSMQLVIRDLQEEDYATYTCAARNSLSTAEGQIRTYKIDVHTPPPGRGQNWGGTDPHRGGEEGETGNGRGAGRSNYGKKLDSNELWGTNTRGNGRQASDNLNRRPGHPDHPPLEIPRMPPHDPGLGGVAPNHRHEFHFFDDSPATSPGLAGGLFALSLLGASSQLPSTCLRTLQVFSKFYFVPGCILSLFPASCSLFVDSYPTTTHLLCSVTAAMLQMIFGVHMFVKSYLVFACIFLIYRVLFPESAYPQLRVLVVVLVSLVALVVTYMVIKLRYGRFSVQDTQQYKCPPLKNNESFQKSTTSLDVHHLASSKVRFFPQGELIRKQEP